VIAGLILAAGESSRMGRDKALLPYHGRTFLENVLETLRNAGVARSVVVLGHHADEIRRAVGLNLAQVIVNAAYRQGQTSSLQAGLRAFEKDDCAAVVLCLVDQPCVSPETVRHMVSTYERSGCQVVIPTFQGQRGHPVLVSRELFEELKNLAPGEGANTVIRRHREAAKFVEVNDRGVLLDIDDSEAYRRLEAGEM